MDQKIGIIQQTAEINQNEAKQALKLAEGDLDKALQMVDYVSQSYMIIHGRASYGSYNKTYLLFSIVTNGKDGEILKSDLVTTSEDDLENINVDIDHKVFIKTLNDIGIKSKKSINSKESQLKFERLFTAADIFELFTLLKADDLSKFKTIFKEKLENFLKEELNLEIFAKTLTKVKLRTYYPQLFSEESNIQNNNSIKQNAEQKDLGLDINLTCQPVISPSSGKRIEELLDGDEILVKISDSSEMGRYLASLLKDSTGMIKGTIEDREFNQGTERYWVLIKFGPNIYGNLSVSPQIKISIPKKEEKSMENKEGTLIDQGTFMLFFFIGLFIIIIIFILIIF